MALDLVAAPSLEPISVAELKLVGRLRAGTAEDALLATIIQAARELGESLVRRAFVTQTWNQIHDAFPSNDDPIRLERPPVQSIVSVTYVDDDQVVQTMDSSAYVLDRTTWPGGWLFPAATTSWPTPGDFINAVTVQYIAGYGDASADVPARIRHWMYMVCTYMYENRTAFDFSGKQIDLPGRFTDSLLDGFRRYAKN